MKAKKIHIKIGKDALRKAVKGEHRKALIEAGRYSIPTHNVQKTVNEYKRNAKHKKKFTED